ncbi:MAG: sulfatase [Planctomycetia bacterium]
MQLRPDQPRLAWIVACAKAACCALLFALAACGSKERERESIVVVIVDTLRRDKVGFHGGVRGLTPNLDALAAEGLVCDDAWSHAPWTLPATASLYSGLLPQRHGAGGDLASGFRAVREDAPLLAEQFRDAGWRTGLVANVDFLGPAFGLARGFQHVDALGSADNHAPRDARRTTDDALRFVREAGDEPFLLVVHYFDVHAEYEPPQPWRGRFADPRDAQASTLPMGDRAQVVARRMQQAPLDPDHLARMEKLYDGEVAYVDDEIGRLWRSLPDSVRSTCTLVVTSDHGEEFGEHGDWEHGHAHHAEVLQVPLFLRGPGIPAGREDALVGHVDVARTLLARFGLDDERARDGRLLGRVLGRAETTDAPHLAHGRFWGPPTTSLRDADTAIHRRASPQAPLLYDRRQDPLEAHALKDEARIQAALVRLAAIETALRLLPPKLGPVPRVDAGTRQRLDGVGYVEAPR